MSLAERNKILEEKIGRLEDELHRKRDGMRDFLFKYLTDTYGLSKLTNEKKRKAILDAFYEVYANWDKF